MPESADPILTRRTDERPEDNAAHDGKATAHVFMSEDAREGATAFAEKRLPVWKGR